MKIYYCKAKEIEVLNFSKYQIRSPNYFEIEALFNQNFLLSF